MKRITALLGLCLCLHTAAAAPLKPTLPIASAPDTTLPVLPKKTSDLQFKPALLSIAALTESGRQGKAVLGFTAQNRPVEVYFFPGTSNKKALVIGGVHGSELSAIAVANQLVESLSGGAAPYYSVVVIPCLFPDNAAQATLHAAEIGSTKNIGRYTSNALPDPNRQMPPLGKAYNGQQPLDAALRPIERENRLLLQLIQDFAPERIVNIHAIRNVARAGIFADPRTDCNGLALGYQTDSLLALSMATYIQRQGGHVKGNALDSSPTARYCTDPTIAPQGRLQKRALAGSSLPNNRGAGVSLGAWASTAVCDEKAQQYRPAIRVITVEFPGPKRPQDYTEAETGEYKSQLQLYTDAIRHIFLGAYSVENELHTSML